MSSDYFHIFPCTETSRLQKVQTPSYDTALLFSLSLPTPSLPFRMARESTGFLHTNLFYSLPLDWPTATFWDNRCHRRSILKIEVLREKDHYQWKTRIGPPQSGQRRSSFRRGPPRGDKGKHTPPLSLTHQFFYVSTLSCP